jgi:uncharacterized protein DUF3592
MKVGFVFVAIGVLLAGIAAFVAWKLVYEPQSWPEADALVVSNTIINPSRDSYTTELTFRYRFEGAERETTVRSKSSSSSYSVAEAMAARFPQGSRLPIRVKPGEPGHIAYDAQWSWENILIVSVIGGMGLLFAAIGIGVVTRGGRRASEAPKDYQTDFPGRQEALRSAIVVRRVALLFGAIAILMFSIAFLVGRSAFREQRDWPHVQAEVVGANVVTTSSKDNRPLRDLSVRFSYEVDGRVYTRETRTGVSRSGSLESLKEKFAPGTRHDIQYRPGNPNVIRFESGLLSDWLAPGILAFIGLVFGGFSVLMLVTTRPKPIEETFGAHDQPWDEGEEE